MSIATTGNGAVTTEWLAARIDGRTINEVSAGVAELIEGGQLAAGVQLPTIREVARALGLGVGTVAEAWSALRTAGLVETRRRGGTIVAARQQQTVGPRDFDGWSGVDLIQTSPDVSLQPPLGEALASTLDAKNLNAWGRDYMTDRLLQAVEPSWPFPAEAWVTAGGGTEALLLAVAGAAPRGSIVAVDEPVGPGVLDTLRDLGLVPVGVAADEQGPMPDSLRAALAHDPAAFIFQPGGPFALRHLVTPERTHELAEVIAAHSAPIWIIEDDSIGPLAEADPPTLGARFPDRVLRIRSYCKAYGIDVRTSVMGGSRELVERSIRQRSHGVGSNSRILQNALAYLVSDPRTAELVGIARERYAGRRESLLQALRAQGLVAHAGPESLLVWVEVEQETDTLLALAAHGIAVGPGSKSFVTSQSTGLLRIAVTLLPDDPSIVASLAETIAKAARGTLREFFD